MPNSLHVQQAGRRWATLDLQGVGGTGRLNPRLQLYFTARPVEHARVVLHDVVLRLEHRQELVGEGRVMGIDIDQDGVGVNFDVVTSQRLLRWVTDSLVPTASVLQIEATLHGSASFRMGPNSASEGSGIIKRIDDPEPGEWKQFVASSSSPTFLQVPRAEWYERVLSPTRYEQYRYLEVVLPRTDEALKQEWAKAVANLDNAERAYASGDDAAVFLHLRGALDALPGAKKAILDDVHDEKKRGYLDALLAKAGEFLHGGRHIAANGTLAGSFPVDHMDAAFALDLMRVLLSHLSLILSAERQRAAN